jgi:hypothetical protein
MRRASLFAGLYVLVQLVLPLDYYARRADPADERFSWRMFSATHMMRCELRLFSGAPRTPVDLERHFHAAWIELGQRGRRSVIEAMAGRLCRSAAPVALELACRQVDGRETVQSADDYCSEGPPWNRG